MSNPKWDNNIIADKRKMIKPPSMNQVFRPVLSFIPWCWRGKQLEIAHYPSKSKIITVTKIECLDCFHSVWVIQYVNRPAIIFLSKHHDTAFSPFKLLSTDPGAKTHFFIHYFLLNAHQNPKLHFQFQAKYTTMLAPKCKSKFKELIKVQPQFKVKYL